MCWNVISISYDFSGEGIQNYLLISTVCDNSTGPFLGKIQRFQNTTDRLKKWVEEKIDPFFFCF
jgi:hypothetical protein